MNVQKYHGFFETAEKTCTNTVFSEHVTMLKPILNSNIVDFFFHFFLYLFFHFLRITIPVRLIFSEVNRKAYFHTVPFIPFIHTIFIPFIRIKIVIILLVPKEK